MKSRKDLIKRKLAQSANHIERAMEDLAAVSWEFREHGEDYMKLFSDAMLSLEVYQMLVGKIAEKAWAMSYEDVKNYLLQ